MSDNRSRRGELDDFWSIENLVPVKKVQSGVSRPTPRPTPSAVEVEFGKEREGVRVYDGEDNLSEIGRIHYVPPHTAAERAPTPKFEYTVDGLLIHRVSVLEWDSAYKYFESFVADAVKYHGQKPTGAVAYRPFFSYMPQYAQMRQDQLAYYIFWRECVRRKTYIKTDYSYILLYIFELINLPHTEKSSRAACDAMALLWRNYRGAFPQLDAHVAEWMCDFCLVHRLPPPELLTTEELCALSGFAALREFYLDPVSARGGEGKLADFFLRFCCSYDYKKSKFYEGRHKELFDRYVPSTLSAMLPQILGRKNGETPLVTFGDSTMTRDIYSGALCAHSNKLRVTVSYTSFSRSHELRFLIGDMVRHIENRLRVWIGTRSRLSVMSLPVNIRDAIDEYMSQRTPTDYLAAMKRADEIKKMPDYERRYDLPKVELSLKGADEIEKSSWATTRILTEAFGGETEEEIFTPTQPVRDSEPPARGSQSIFGELGEFVSLCLDGDVGGQIEFARRVGKLPDAIADEINAITADSDIGDIVLEEADGGYRVIEDYENEVRGLL